jgi:hypothetical protein
VKRRCFRYNSGSVGVQVGDADRIVITPRFVFGRPDAIRQVAVFRDKEILAIVTYNLYGYPYVREPADMDALRKLPQDIQEALDELNQPKQYDHKSPDVIYLKRVLVLQASARQPILAND